MERPVLPDRVGLGLPVRQGGCAAMNAAKTAAQRKAEERRRHREAGRVAVTVHVQADYVPEVRALEAKLQRREKRKPSQAG